MLTVLIYVHVKPEFVDEFRSATIENARHSVLEPGIAIFEAIQQADDPTRFVLIEAYRTEDAPKLHRETAHYLAWRDAVEKMMVEPRVRVLYESLQ